MTDASNSTVVFLNRFYAPDVAATAQMLSDLAEDLVAAGWDVTVITSSTPYERLDQQLSPREVREGVKVWRVSGTRFGRASVLGRLLDYLSYFVSSFVALMRIPRPDIIVAMSDPPFILLSAVVAARVRRARVIYWAQDVYPELAAKLGVISERSPVYNLLQWLAGRLLMRCDRVIGLGPAMVNALVRQGSRPERTVAIHNWADEQAIHPVSAPENWFLAHHALEGKFVVLYSGNAGKGHTFDALCEVMVRLRNADDVIFLFIGGGKKSSMLRAFAQKNELHNVRFMDYVGRNDLAYSLSAASVSIVTEDTSVSGLLLPSKTYGILASGRPIIFVGSDQSDVAAIVRDCACGIVIRPDDASGLENAILGLRGNADLRTEMGTAARAAAETRFSRRRASEEWASQLRTLPPWQPHDRQRARDRERIANTGV